MSNKIKRKFDWKPYFDERSRKYAIRGLLGSKSIQKRPVLWEEGTVLDQGSEGACVGFGWMGEVLAEPIQPTEQPSEALGNKLAFFYYEEAKKNDEWPGERYDGTSVLAGAKVMKEYGLISEYRWCFSIEDIIDTVIEKGPVVLGIPWYSSMYKTDIRGLTVVSGDPVGGHCVVITGYEPAKQFGRHSLEVFRWRNSWGEDYGINGSGYIKVSDLRKLFYEGGEACVPLIRHKPTLEYPPKPQTVSAKNNKRWFVFNWLDRVFRR